MNDIKSDEVRRISVVNVKGKEKQVASYLEGSRLVIERNNLTKGIYCVLIYGKEIINSLSVPDNISGSHIDMIPTLIELVAPKGFSYHTFGHDLLDHEVEQYGLGDGVVITPKFIAQSIKDIQKLEETDTDIDINQLEKLLKKERQFQAIGWWRDRKGSMLPTVKH